MKFFNFTPIQQQHLAELARQKAVILLEMKFNEPEKDALKMRQHAATQAQFEILQELIADEWPDPQPEQQAQTNLPV